MTHWEIIYETAIDDYGLITTARAKELGVSAVELPRWVKIGWLQKRGHGVYRLTKRIPTDFDHYAEAVAFAGRGSVIYGESVLAMMNLAFVNPMKINVATKIRLRKKLPDWMKVITNTSVENPACYEGIPCQPMAEAIFCCRKSVPKERLLSAIAEARSQGYINLKEERILKKEISK